MRKDPGLSTDVLLILPEPSQPPEHPLKPFGSGLCPRKNLQEGYVVKVKEPFKNGQLILLHLRECLPSKWPQEFLGLKL